MYNNGMKQIQIETLEEALRQSWSSETSFFDAIPSSNLVRGQCVVSSLVVQDFLGGELTRVKVEGVGIDEKHYFNVLDDGTVIDTTRMQYGFMQVSLTPAPVDLRGEHASIRDKVLDDEGTRRRYLLLRKRVEEFINKQI